MPDIEGVLETALYVADVERSANFYQNLFGFETLHADNGFCALAVAGRHVLLLFEKGSASRPSITPGGVIPSHDGSGELHLAFSIATADLEAWRRRLFNSGIEIESEVAWPRSGHSLYFRDPDEHLVELVTPGCWAIY